MEPIDLDRILALLERVKKEITTNSNNKAIGFIELCVNEKLAWMAQDEPEDDGSRCPNCDSIVFTGHGDTECCADCGRLVSVK